MCFASLKFCVFGIRKTGGHTDTRTERHRNSIYPVNCELRINYHIRGAFNADFYNLTAARLRIVAVAQPDKQTIEELIESFFAPQTPYHHQPIQLQQHGNGSSTSSSIGTTAASRCALSLSGALCTRRHTTRTRDTCITRTRLDREPFVSETRASPSSSLQNHPPQKQRNEREAFATVVRFKR